MTVRPFINLGDGLHELLHNSQANKMDILMTLFFTTQGRLNRKFLIYRWLFTAVILMLLRFLCIMLFLPLLAFPISVLGLINVVTMSIRRFHDLGKSGIWAFLLFIPIINFFVVLYLLFCRGSDGPNEYGDDPLNYST